MVQYACSREPPYFKIANPNGGERVFDSTKEAITYTIYCLENAIKSFRERHKEFQGKADEMKSRIAELAIVVVDAKEALEAAKQGRTPEADPKEIPEPSAVTDQIQPQDKDAIMPGSVVILRGDVREEDSDGLGQRERAIVSSIQIKRSARATEHIAVVTSRVAGTTHRVPIDMLINFPDNP